MSLDDHFLVWSCCGETHYETTDSLRVGEVIRAAIVQRLCAGCPAPETGVEIRCCHCGEPIRYAYSLTDGMRHGPA